MTRTEILEQYAPRMENLLRILHDLQKRNPRNYLSEKDLTQVAGYLNTSLASIHGVAGYYTLFSLIPRGKHIIRICRSPVCHMAGESDVLSALHGILGIDIGETTTDAQFTLETTECLGQCDRAPAIAVDETVYGDLTPDTIKAIIRGYGRKKGRTGRVDR